MAQTIVTCTLSALSRAADAILARPDLSKNAILNDLSAAIAGPGHDWGRLKHAPGGHVCQPGLRRPDAPAAPAQDPAVTEAWVLTYDERDDWARGARLFSSQEAALAAVSADPWWHHRDYSHDEVIAGLRETGAFFFHEDRDPDGDGAPYAITLERCAIETRPSAPAPSQDTAPAACDAQWVLIADPLDLPETVHGAENFRLFRTRSDLDAYTDANGLACRDLPDARAGDIAPPAGLAQGVCHAAPIERARFRADFRPEAWIRDQAVAVDPEGETAWEVTPAALRVRARDQDHVRDDPAAPDWIRTWSGPFTIEIFAEIA